MYLHHWHSQLPGNCCNSQELVCPGKDFLEGEDFMVAMLQGGGLSQVHHADEHPMPGYYDVSDIDNLDIIGKLKGCTYEDS